MDTQSVQPPAKKMRKRSKSVHTKETSPVPEPEPAVAPNLNGDENAVTTEVDPKPHELDETPPIDDRSKSDGEFSENVHGRKRKASEMKDDSVTEDENSDARKEDGETGPGEAERKSDDKGDASVSDNTSLSESADDSKELKLPPKQTLGKGKRARIPNKRYSDILLSSSPHIKYHADADNSKPRTKLSSLENGEAQIHPESQEKENAVAESGSFTELTVKQESEESSPALSSPAVAAIKSRISLGSPGTKKQKISVDLSNPNYLKPFQYGWKRELVYRAASDSGAKRNGDIYYYTPGGKKVRSMREVSENLKDKKLTLDDFTFFKEPLGIEDPEKEIIREAKFKTAGTVVKKATPKVKTPKPGSPKALSPTLKASTPVAADSPKVKNVQRTNSFKMKLPVARQSKQGKLNKKAKEDEDMDVGIYPPNWQSPKKPNKWGNKTPDAARTKRAPKTAGVPSGKPEGSSYMDNYLQNLAYGYNTLLYVFQYLKVQDLLRAGCVCHMWRDIASHPLLWRTVRMKNSQVHSFEGLANTLEKHNTVHLDLRKMLLPSGGDEIWPSFSQAIKKVDSLRKIELCRCPATVVEQLPLSNPKLEVINAVTIKCEQMSLAPFRSLKNLQELRLKSTSGLTLTSDLFALQELTQLKHLSLMSVKDLNKQNLDVIADLKNLESLDLGECTDFPKTFGVDILTRLTKLEKLRLEKGQGNCYTFEILEAVKNMPKLEQLELVNFDIKTGFDKALGACTNIKKLLIIPTYISQSATTNHMVLGGVLRLRSTLSHFVWGVTLELLRVTELFVDQCEEPKEKEKKDKKAPTNGDSIPVLKPVPLLTESKTEILPAHDPPQVEILPLPNLQKLLLQSLPTTRVKILKIPFHATWRQSITDTVN